jgi:protoheme IX farnesyltransferase
MFFYSIFYLFAVFSALMADRMAASLMHLIGGLA